MNSQIRPLRAGQNQLANRQSDSSAPLTGEIPTETFEAGPADASSTAASGANRQVAGKSQNSPEPGASI